MKHTLLFSLVLCFSIQLSAQQFNFSPSVSQGCTPLVITFSNTSDPAIINDYRYEWVVEPGKFSTELLQMENTYLHPGAYNAEMKVFDLNTGMLIETVTKPITVFRDPDVQITSDKDESCVRKPFQFSITSTDSDAPIASHMWILSDGSTYTMETPPAHNFSYAGTHSIFCAVTDANGCTNRERHTITVVTHDDAPTTSIVANTQRSCDPTLQVQFTNISPSDPLLARFEWDFGDGSPKNSSTQNPSHNYNGYGTYYAKLTNVSIHDCEATAQLPIQLIEYKPDFTIADEGKTIDAHNKACNGTVTFTDKTLPANVTISYAWDYLIDNSIDSRGKTLSVTENTGGTKQVKLTVNNGVCERSIIKSFEVEAPLQIGYTPHNEFYCEPTNALYSATSNISGSTFEWEINGNPQTGQNTYYQFNEEGMFSDKLYVTSPNNCKDSIVKTNNVELVFPEIELSIASAESGCAPLSVTFTESHSFNTTRDQIVSIDWDFDYSNPNFTVEASSFDAAQHTYPLRGGYQAAVRATTQKGCKVFDFAIDNPVTNEREIVKVGNKPSGDLIFLDTIICASEPTKFLLDNLNSANAPLNSPYDSLFVSYPPKVPNDYPAPNNMFLAPSISPNAEFPSFLRDSIGEHYVFFTLSDHGCRSNSQQDVITELGNTPPIPTTIHVHGPIVEITPPKKDCNDNYNYVYSLAKRINLDFSSPNQYLDWYINPKGGNLGTPLASSHNQDVIHVDFQNFYGRGVYEITVVAYNGDEDCHGAGACNCSDTVTVETIVTDIKADFMLANPTPCLGDSAFVKIGPNARDIDWNKTFWVKDGVSEKIDSIFHFDSKSIRGIDIVTADRFDCPASMRIPVKVYQPTAALKASIVSDCLPFESEFTDITREDLDTLTLSREWDFGSGTPASGNNKVHTVHFDQEGFVSPMLKVCNILGCCDSIVETDYIKPIVPNSKFTVSTPKLCLDHSAIITRSFSDPYLDNNIHKFSWDFGDGTSLHGTDTENAEYINSDTVRHKYAIESTNGNFTISLTAFSRSPIDPTRECEATSTESIDVKSQAAQIMIKNKDKCKEPEQVFIVYIDNAWYSRKYKSMEWYKIDNDNEVFVNTTAPRAITFPNYGTQGIKLITHSDYYGCETDTARIPIEVPGYEVQFEADKYLVCVGEEITFTRTHAVNVDAYTSFWSFGDGVQNYTDLEQAVHAYSSLPDTENERFKVQYIVDAPNCKPQNILRYIELHPVEANFLRGIDDLDSIGCAPNTVEFINTSIGARNEKFLWTFGDGSTSTEKNPTHTFTAATSPYEVSLAIEGVACNDTTTKKVYFYPRPNVQFTYDSVLCLGENTAIDAQGTFASIAWTPAQYFNPANAAQTQYTPRKTGMAYANITSLYGCNERDSLFIYVQQPGRYQGAPDSALLYYRTPTELVLASNPTANIIAGQIYNVNNTPVEGVFYEWTPSDYLSCTHCVSPNIHLECGTAGFPSCIDFPQTVNYHIYMYDTLGCFTNNANIEFNIVVETKAALPQAFTPNGDGHNDIAYVRGWGIKEFLHLRIYNRWGQLIFESNDLQHGWDGVYNGKDQPMESYAYTIQYIDTQNERQEQKGYITLIR